MYKNIDSRFVQLFEILEGSGVITSRSEAAKLLNYKPQAFNEILKGRTKVGVELIQRFCIIYKANANYLLFGVGEYFREEYKRYNLNPNDTSPDIIYDPPGEIKKHRVDNCESCEEKNKLIKTKDEVIDLLKEKIEMLTQKGEQKRKAV